MVEKAKEEVEKIEKVNVLENTKTEENNISTEGIKILLVEDDAINTEITKKILAEMRYFM